MKYTEKKIEEIERSDIDLEQPYMTGDEGNEIEFAKDIIFQDAESIDIDETIGILQKLKEKGANRVYIMPHSDHHGYVFTGVNVKPIN